MATSGHTTQIKHSGTAVALTTEAMTLSGADTVATITDATKRIIDPDTALSVIDNGTPLADTAVVINYLAGTATIGAGTFTGPVTITGAYLPTHAVAEARGVEINLEANLLDSTLMAAATTCRSRIVGLIDASGTVTGLDDLSTDLDSGGTTIVPFTDMTAGTRRVLETTFPSGKIFRAFVKFEGIKAGASAEDLFEATLAWKAVLAKGVDQTEGSAVAFI